MKIAIFTDTYLPTINGITYAIKSWKSEIEKRGHDVTVVCPNAPGVSDVVSVPSIELPFYENYYSALYPHTDHDFSNYDAVHLNSFFMIGYYGYRVAKKHDINIISMVHTPINEYIDYVTTSEHLQRPLWEIYKRWEGRILKKSDVRIALSEYIKDYIKGITNNQDVVRLTNGVNTDFFEPVENNEFRKKYHINSKKVIGFTGRLSEEKRIEELIEYAKQYDGTVLIGGNGPHKQEYESINNSENVEFLGFLDREELPSFYSTLDLLIFPSRVENDPLIVLEANACGTPVIGANAAGLVDSINVGKNGYLYEPGNIDDLSHKIEKGYGDLNSLEKSSRRYAVENSISNTVDTLISLYKRDNNEN